MRSEVLILAAVRAGQAHLPGSSFARISLAAHTTLILSPDEILTYTLSLPSAGFCRERYRDRRLCGYRQLGLGRGDQAAATRILGAHQAAGMAAWNSTTAPQRSTGVTSRAKPSVYRASSERTSTDLNTR